MDVVEGVKFSFLFWCKISQIGYIYEHCQELNRVWQKNGFNHPNCGGGGINNYN